MVRSISNYSRKTMHWYSDMTKPLVESWHSTTSTSVRTDDFGYGVGKRVSSWWEERWVMSNGQAFITGLTIGLGGTQDVETRKVTDTEYTVDNSEVSERLALGTLAKRKKQEQEASELNTKGANAERCGDLAKAKTFYQQAYDKSQVSSNYNDYKQNLNRVTRKIDMTQAAARNTTKANTAKTNQTDDRCEQQVRDLFNEGAAAERVGNLLAARRLYHQAFSKSGKWANYHTYKENMDRVSRTLWILGIGAVALLALAIFTSAFSLLFYYLPLYVVSLVVSFLALPLQSLSSFLVSIIASLAVTLSVSEVGMILLLMKLL